LAPKKNKTARRWGHTLKKNYRWLRRYWLGRYRRRVSAAEREMGGPMDSC
jgi:hypothetical protein